MSVRVTRQPNVVEYSDQHWSLRCERDSRTLLCAATGTACVELIAALIETVHESPSAIVLRFDVSAVTSVDPAFRKALQQLSEAAGDKIEELVVYAESSLVAMPFNLVQHEWGAKLRIHRSKASFAGTAPTGVSGPTLHELASATVVVIKGQTIDVRQWPLLQSIGPETLNVEMVRESMDWIERYCAFRAEPYASILDMRKVRGMPSDVRRYINDRANHGQKNNAAAHRYSVANAMVFASPVMKIFLNAMFMVFKPHQAQRVFTNVEDAMEWARQYLPNATAERKVANGG